MLLDLLHAEDSAREGKRRIRVHAEHEQRLQLLDAGHRPLRRRLPRPRVHLMMDRALDWMCARRWQSALALAGEAPPCRSHS